MSTCIAPHVKIDAIDKEIARLEEQINDIGVADIDVKEMAEEYIGYLQNVRKTLVDKDRVGYQSAVDKLGSARMSMYGSSVTAELNMESPRIGKSTVEVLEAYHKDGVDKVRVRYGSGKIATYDADMLQLDQKDVRSVFANGFRERGSEADVVVDEYGFERQQVDLVNNLEKSLELFDRLGERNEMVSEKHKARMRRVLEMFVDDSKKFIPQMYMYLKEHAQKTGGVIKASGIYIGVADEVRAVMNQKSAQEVYVHEIGHAATEFALQDNDVDTKKIRRRLQQLRRQVRENIKIEDLMPTPENSVDAAYERQIAEKLWKYIFENEESGLSEFLIHGLTNEQLADILDKLVVNKIEETEPTNMLEALLFWMQKLMQRLSTFARKEKLNMTGTELLVKLAGELAEANNKALRVKEDSGWVAEIRDATENINSKMSNIIKDRILKLNTEVTLPRRPIAGSSKIEWVKWVWQIGPRVVADKRLRPGYREFLKTLGLSYVGDVQTMLTHVTEADTLQRAIERLGLLSENIDKVRETRARITADQIRKEFGQLSNAEREVLTLVGLDTDLSTVYGKIENLEELLEDRAKLASEISYRMTMLKGKVDEATGNYYAAQIAGLGYFMATHQSNMEGLVLNAEGIAKGINRDTRTNASAEVIDEIDMLTTLTALTYTATEAKLKMAELMRREPDGVKFFMELHNGVKTAAKDTVFANSTLLMIKGYTKEIFDQDINMEIAPLSIRKMMEADGFKFVKELKKDTGDTNSIPMAMYISKVNVQQSFKKGAMRLTDIHRKGTTLTDVRRLADEENAALLADTDVKRLNVAARRAVRQMEAGTYKHRKDGTSLVPLYSDKGTVVNYRYVLDKTSKREYLGQDIKAPTVLGRMWAAIDDKISTEEHNMTVIDLMLEDSKKNAMKGAIGRNQMRYVEVGPDGELEEVYKLMPKDMRQYLDSKLVDPVTKKRAMFKVRADMLRFYFGMREGSLLDVVDKYNVLRKMTPREARYVISLIEKIWSAVVSVAKVDIVIRTPMVLIGNIVSNINYSVQSGYNPVTVLKMQLDAFVGLREYIDLTHEVIRLQNRKATGRLSNAEEGKLSLLKQDLKQHQMSELIDEGMFQAIIEDVGSEEIKDDNVITKAIDKKLENMPQIVRDGANWLYLTSRTKPFQMMTMATQFSDFTARYVQHELNKERLFNEIEKKAVNGRIAVSELAWLRSADNGLKDSGSISTREAKDRAVVYSRQQVLDAFVNYSKPEGKVIDWANRMGMVMFTKYFMRIQRAISQNIVDNPVYAIMMMLGQGMLADLDSIDDQSIFAKDLSYVFKNPVDHLERLIMPTGFELVTGNLR